MKKGTLKKSIVVMMAVVMLFSLAGCGTNDGKKKLENGKSEETQNTREMVFQGKDFLTGQYQGDISKFFVKNGRIYFNTCEWIPENTPDEDTNDGTTINRFYSANVDGSNVTEMPLPPSMKEDQWIEKITRGGDDTTVFLVNVYNAETQKFTHELIKTDEQGNELFRTNITKELNMTEDDNTGAMLMDDKGRLIVTVGQVVFILDGNGKPIGKVKSENYVNGAAITKDGDVIVASSVSSVKKPYAQVQVLDVDGKKWGNTITLDLKCFSSEDSIVGGIDYDFYYKDNSGIYGYDIEDEKADKIMDYMASGIMANDSWEIIPVSKDRMLSSVYDQIGTWKFTLYSKVDPAAIQDKKTIIFGGTWIDEDIKDAAVEFNKSSKEYQIEFRDYREEEDPLTKMIMDIMAGNIPDIICLDVSEVTVDQYIEKGMLEDLTPYFERDPELSTDDILDSVLEAMKVDGKIYYIMSSFYIDTIVARTADVGDGTGWTYDELKALLEKKGEDVRLSSAVNKSDMLNLLLRNGFSDFADKQTGECRFDSQDFKDILEICNSRGGTDEEFDWDDTPGLIQEDKMLFLEQYVDPESIEVYKQVFGEDVTYIGYPNKEKEGSYFQFMNQMGIYAQSEVKDGAWEFIRTFITKEYLTDERNLILGIPVRKDCFDMMMRSKTTTEAYTDELDQEILPLDTSWNWEGAMVDIKPLTDEEAEMYINLLNNTKRNDHYDEKMMNIVLEEAEPYFAGDKSLDETAEIIQNRIRTYINESR